MKKIKNKIIVLTLIYCFICIVLTKILKMYNLIFLQWLKSISFFIISVGLVAGFFQVFNNIDKNKKVIRVIVGIFVIISFFVILIANNIYFVFVISEEEYTQYEGKNMIKETRQFYNLNYINYYDYINIFVRSNQERVHIQYDDTISESEYCGTQYYDKDGNEVENFDGIKFVDLSSLKNYASEGDATYQEVKELLDKVQQDYKEKIYKVEVSDNYLFIYLSNIEEKFDTVEKYNVQNAIQTFISAETLKENSLYGIRFWNGYIVICNETYINYQTPDI